MRYTSEIETVWDVIIVGSGMAGAVCGYRLAKSGLRVLILEKGLSPENGKVIKGDFAERIYKNDLSKEDLKNSLRWHEDYIDQNNSGTFMPFIGCGGGGSTALYGMALERFSINDFRPLDSYGGKTGANIKENWPIQYHDLENYYTEIEDLFAVSGITDPLKPYSGFNYKKPPPLNKQNHEIFQQLAAKGFHPYQLPLACNYEKGNDRCQGFADTTGAKCDAYTVCIKPAIDHYNLILIDDCEVIKLNATDKMVGSVVCKIGEEQIAFSGRQIILAAGALSTPLLLRASVSEKWKHGLANGSGQVGKNLMRHLIDLFIIKTKSFDPNAENLKQLAFNDLYDYEEKKYGTVQSFGNMIDPASMFMELVKEFCSGKKKLLSGFFYLLKPIIIKIISSMFSRSVVLASIMEDLPYESNQVVMDENFKKVIRYNVSELDKNRNKKFLKIIKEIFSPYSVKIVKQAFNNRRIAHACGTCRMGTSPETSVVDKNNKCHELDNLYIIDSSFFPSSGGTNPALTIAANALRVADKIILTENEKSLKLQSA